MPKDLTIDEICERALPLVSCPVTNQNLKAKRVWLKQQIESKIAQAKYINSVGPTEFKSPNMPHPDTVDQSCFK